jgi:hypothetical protein
MAARVQMANPAVSSPARTASFSRIHRGPREEKRDRVLRERDTMFRRWRRFHREELEQALRGPWGEDLSELLEFLTKMGPEDGQALIDLVKRQGWAAAGSGNKYLVLREIDQRIIRLREGMGLTPIDDGLPWGEEEDTVFTTIKKHLFDTGDAAPVPSI